MSSPRPDMRRYFQDRIDVHVRGRSAVNLPRPVGVDRVVGDVTDRLITVTMRDSTVYRWTGGRYATRKVRLCYAPLMPRPTDRVMSTPQAGTLLVMAVTGDTMLVDETGGATWTEAARGGTEYLPASFVAASLRIDTWLL